MAVVLRMCEASIGFRTPHLGRLQRPEQLFACPDVIPTASLRGVGPRLYDLRHTAATILLKQKVSPKVVQERLGHSTIMLTMDTYSHVLEGMQEAATAAMDSALGSSRFG
jgi:integrase